MRVEACKAHVIAQGTMMSNFSAVKTYFTNYGSVLSRILFPPLATCPPYLAEVAMVQAVARIEDVELDNLTRAVTVALLPLTRNLLRVM